MYCKQCGKQIPDDAIVCVYCGVAVTPASVPDPEVKSRIAYILLGVFLGCLGVHNFYAGYTGKAVAQLLISVLLCWTFLAPLVVFIWCIVDICNVTKDAQGRPFAQ